MSLDDVEKHLLADRKYEFVSMKPLWLDGYTRKYTI